MFSLFRKKTDEEKLTSHIADITKNISDDGGPLQACLKFMEFAVNSAFYHETGFLLKSECSHDASMVMLASLKLLAIYKNNKCKNEQWLLLAENTFKSSSKIMTDEEIKQFLLSPKKFIEKIEVDNAAWKAYLALDNEKLQTFL